MIEISGADLNQPLAGKTLGETLLAPTRIYVKPLLALTKSVQVHALAHITGGGLSENIPRVLPQNTVASIDTGAWRRPAVFDWLQEHGNISDIEMLRTFNNGIGMVVCVAEQDAETATRLLQDQGETVYNIGRIEACDCAEPCVSYKSAS